MTRRRAADRYARALFEVALVEADPDCVGEELASVAGLAHTHGELARAFTHPAIPPQVKRRLVDAIAARLELTPVLRKLLLLLAERDRLVLLSELDEAYRDRLRRHHRIVRAHVTTAVPLPAERAHVLARSLEAATGRTIELTTEVDPGILGGVVARLGSVVFDGSLARQLERLREALAARA